MNPCPSVLETAALPTELFPSFNYINNMNSHYYKYYNEIKNRFTLIIFCWIFCFCVCYGNKEVLLFLIAESSNTFGSTSQTNYFIFTNITEVFEVYIKLAVFISNQIIMNVIIYQILMFLSLGLYNFEFAKLKVAFQFFLVTWVISSLFLYKILVPLSWSFFLSFQENADLNGSLSLFFEAKLNEYLDYFINLYFLALLNCQFLTLLLLILINLNDHSIKIKRLRKLFYFIFVVFSTVMTPPDVFSQMIVSCSLIILYEISLFIKFVMD